MEILMASSSMDGGIQCWDLKTGDKLRGYDSCASTRHGLISIGDEFIAASQLAGPIHYWSWNEPQVEVRSIPAEPIVSLIADTEGAYIAGGGHSGDIYFWQVSTGKLLRKWRAHSGPVTCMAYSNDDQRLISGSKDGTIKVWLLLGFFDDTGTVDSYEHSLTKHDSPVTDVVCGTFPRNNIIVSASEDGNCKVWSLFEGKLLRDIQFPSPVKAICLSPMEDGFYAGGMDGRVYVAALTAESNSKIPDLTGYGEPFICLARGLGFVVSGAEDGTIRVFDEYGYVVHTFRHAGPVNNLVILRRGGLRASRWRRPLPSLQVSRDDEQDLHVPVILSGQKILNEKEFLSEEFYEEEVEQLRRRVKELRGHDRMK